MHTYIRQNIHTYTRRYIELICNGPSW